MHWQDEGYLLAKKNLGENSIIIETFTSNHGKYSGIVYGGSSRKQKRNFQIGNKLFINFKSKNERKIGYFNIELIKPISPLFFNDKERSGLKTWEVKILGKPRGRGSPIHNQKPVHDQPSDIVRRVL